MAGIDKTYVNYEQLLEAIDWAKNIGEVTIENGYKFFPLDWIKGYNNIDENGVLQMEKRDDYCYVLWNTPTWFDRWLWCNCPLSFVKERLQEQYSLEYLKEFEDWVYVPEPERTAKYKFTMEPNDFGPGWKWLMNNGRRKNPWPGSCKQTTYRIEVIVPGEKFERHYDDQTDNWYQAFGMLPAYGGILGDYVWQEHHKNAPTKKAIIRQLRKWNLPKGTIVKVVCFRYKYMDFKITVK